MTSGLRRRLAQLDAAIVEQKQVLKALERDRADVQRQLHATSIFPLVSTLPVEITADIFCLCLPSIEELREDVEYERPISWSLGHRAPNVFLGVCQSWREIAIATPALWATFFLTVGYVSEDVLITPGALEEFIDAWLGRAALRPLSVIFRAIDSASLFTPERMRDVIRRHADRIKYMELELDQSSLCGLKLDSVAFPLLQCAVVEQQPSTTNTLDPWNPTEIYTNAPQIRHFILRGPTDFSLYALPWLRLTRYEGGIDSLDLFEFAPNLVDVKCSVEWEEPVPASIINHFCLQSLTLVDSQYEEDPLDILPHLNLPALQFLRLTDECQPDDPADALGEFLGRSSPPLRSLSARVEYENFYNWNRSCFSCVANTLENLELRAPDPLFQRGLFNSGLNSSGVCLPRLRNLHLIDTVGTNFTQLTDLLYTRSTTPRLAKLRSFRLVAPSSAVLLLQGDPPGTEIRYSAGDTPRINSAASRFGIDIYIGTAERAYFKHVHHAPRDPPYEFVY